MTSDLADLGHSARKKERVCPAKTGAVRLLERSEAVLGKGPGRPAPCEIHTPSTASCARATPQTSSPRSPRDARQAERRWSPAQGRPVPGAGRTDRLRAGRELRGRVGAPDRATARQHDADFAVDLGIAIACLRRGLPRDERIEVDRPLRRSRAAVPNTRRTWSGREPRSSSIERAPATRRAYSRSRGTYRVNLRPNGSLSDPSSRL